MARSGTCGLHFPCNTQQGQRHTASSTRIVDRAHVVSCSSTWRRRKMPYATKAFAPRYKSVAFILMCLPAALIAIYLIYQGWNGITHGASTIRPWTLGQRLLTEPRILMDYLRLLWLPRPYTPGLFNDHIQPSLTLWSPWSTLPSLLAVAGLIGWACLSRRHLAVLSMAVLFYFVGQSLESSTIALELYFEHRNYLPAILMFWPLALWLCDIPVAPKREIAAPSTHLGASRNLSAKTTIRLKALFAAILILGLSSMTFVLAGVWGNAKDQALLWAALNPGSPRAQASAAQAEMSAGYPVQAAARLELALQKSPTEVQLALNLFAAQCQANMMDQKTIDASRLALASARDPGSLLTTWFERAIEGSSHPPCPQADLATIESLLDAAQKNPRLMEEPGRRQDLYYLRGRVALAEGKGDAALYAFNMALDQQIRETAALRQASLLGSAGFPEQGLAHLEHFQSVQSEQATPALACLASMPGFSMARDTGKRNGSI